MQRHVIVAAPKEKYLRVRRSCAAAGEDDCATTQMYYCPGACHQIGILAEQDEQSAESSSAANSGEGDAPAAESE